MKFQLIVDSCCEPVGRLTEGIDFTSVPLSMTVDGETYYDDSGLNLPRFLRRMRQSKTRVMSSCPPPQAYADAYARGKGKHSFVVTLSSQLSGSYSSAVIAKDLAGAGETVTVFDSRSASAGEILLALKVRELAESCDTPREVVSGVEQFREKMHTFFVLENLDNLQKSGRMSLIAAKLATVMQIRPILGADSEGNIASFAKVRGTRAAVDQLCTMMGEYGDTRGRTLVITHCGNAAEADRLAKMAQARYFFREVLVARTGGLSSMYANQGGIIVAF